MPRPHDIRVQIARMSGERCDIYAVIGKRWTKNYLQAIYFIVVFAFPYTMQEEIKCP